MMKTSEPRTFSWISTKISMSAKRRTLDLVSDNGSASAISCASAGLELPATSLIDPFLADIDASPGALVDRTFSIPDTHKLARFDCASVISSRRRSGKKGPSVFLRKIRIGSAIFLFSAGAVAERGAAEGVRRRAGIGNRRPLAARRRRGGGLSGRRSVDHAGKPRQAGLGDAPEHHIVGGGPSVAAGLSGGFLAGQPQRALLVAVVDVPY